jgi:hypothetical protein
MSVAGPLDDAASYCRPVAASRCQGSGIRLQASEDDDIWLASFMRYDLGYFDLEQKTLQPLDNPFGPRLSPMS